MRYLVRTRTSHSFSAGGGAAVPGGGRPAQSPRLALTRTVRELGRDRRHRHASTPSAPGRHAHARCCSHDLVLVSCASFGHEPRSALEHRIAALAPRHRLPRRRLPRPHPIRPANHGRTPQPRHREHYASLDAATSPPQHAEPAAPCTDHSNYSDSHDDLETTLRVSTRMPPNATIAIHAVLAAATPSGGYQAEPCGHASCCVT